MNREQLLEIMRLCGCDMSALDAVELAYEAGFLDGVESVKEAKND